MGNRAVIVGKESDFGIYLQWNGGRDSVEAFLEYSRLKGHPGIVGSGDGIFALSTIITNFFGKHGYYVRPMKGDEAREARIWDNGIYIVEGNEIIERRSFEGKEQDDYELIDMLKRIDAAQPAEYQLGEEFIEAEEIPLDDLQIGDRYMEIDPVYGKVVKRTIVGKNKRGPYTDRYPNRDNPNQFDWNIENYPEGIVRLVK